MALTQEQSQELGAAIEHRRRTLAELIGELDPAAAARELEELRGVDAARQRFEEGNYGTCIDCGQDIGYARLRATPTAIRCILCQTRHEKTLSGAAGSSL